MDLRAASVTDDNFDMVGQPCMIEGCFATVVGADRCAEHGGKPTMEWRTDAFGAVTFSVRIEPDEPDAEAA
jgi:hypothetical protein